MRKKNELHKNGPVQVGLVDFVTYTPKETMDAAELSALVDIPADVLEHKMGIRRIHVGAPEDQPGGMALRCSQDLLDKTGFPSEALDMILYAGETYAEYLCWTAGLMIQGELGASNAYAWDLSFRCAGLPLALKTVRDMMQVDASLKNVLVCGGNKNCQLVDYQDPYQSHMFSMGPGGFALLLRRDHPQNVLLDTGIFTDPSFCNDIICPTGGTLNPLTQEMVMAMAKDPEQTRRFNKLTLPDGKNMRARLRQVSQQNLIHTIQLACTRSGVIPQDIGFIGMVHIGNRAHYALLDTLGINAEKTVFLWDDGHCGQADALLALGYGIKQNKIKDGDLVALVGAGIGYVYGCTLLQWGQMS